MSATTNRNSNRRTVPIIGLIGGIASGKSNVANEFQRQGCAVIDADRLGHEALNDSSNIKQLEAWFGAQVLTSDGLVDRRMLSSLVFDSESPAARQRLELLENLLHPQIRRAAERQIAELSRTKEPPKAIIVDAPLLIEAGWVSLCDYLFFVDTPAEVRLQRSLERGWSEAQWRSREAAQASMEAKRRAATHFIGGQLSPIELQLRITELLQELRVAEIQCRPDC